MTRKNDAFVAKIVITRLMKGFMAMFAPAESLPSPATLLSGICLWFFLFVFVFFSTWRESVGIPVEVVVMSPRVTRKRIPIAKVLLIENANYES